MNLGTHLKKISRSDRRDALEEVGEYIIQSILEHVGDAKSPVEGGIYKRSLDDEYKDEKKKVSSNLTANMEASGEMLDSLEYKVDTSGVIEFGYFDKDQAQKADNHNKFSPESKKTKLPPRQHIPRKNENLKRDIMKEIHDILSSYASED